MTPLPIHAGTATHVLTEVVLALAGVALAVLALVALFDRVHGRTEEEKKERGVDGNGDRDRNGD
jgi:hypothetical protein